MGNQTAKDGDIYISHLNLYVFFFMDICTANFSRIASVASEIHIVQNLFRVTEVRKAMQLSNLMSIMILSFQLKYLQSVFVTFTNVRKLHIFILYS